MEKYRKVPQQKEQSAQADETVVRVQVQGKIVQYVNYASGLLDDPSKARVQVVGLGRAINKAVTVAEILRRKFGDVHQLTKLSSVTITDRYEPLEEGLDVRKRRRFIALSPKILCLELCLSSAVLVVCPCHVVMNLCLIAQASR